MLLVCGLIYDEALGWPQDGIVAGTRWEDMPEDWVGNQIPVAGEGAAKKAA